MDCAARLQWSAQTSAFFLAPNTLRIAGICESLQIESAEAGTTPPRRQTFKVFIGQCRCNRHGAGVATMRARLAKSQLRCVGYRASTSKVMPSAPAIRTCVPAGRSGPVTTQ